jgi:hypothetical protein
MSNGDALAAVSAALKQLLSTHVLARATQNAVTVNVLPPDRIATSSDEQPRLNLFLYQVAQEARGRELPNQLETARARRTALNLRYLLTAYARDEFEAETLLGDAMHVLEATPVLGRDLIEQTLTTVRGGPDVAEVLGRLQITSVNLTTEELSALWLAFRVPYRAAVGYQVRLP